MKTIKQWLEELPEPYRSQSLANMADIKCQAHGVIDPEQKRSSLRGVLMSAFAWSQTPEMFEYWDNLYESLPTS